MKKLASSKLYASSLGAAVENLLLSTDKQHQLQLNLRDKTPEIEC